MPRSALEVVHAYIREAWNEGKVELLSELCADPIIRHDANSVTEIRLADQVARIAQNYDELRPFFEEIVFAGDDEHITLIWNATGRDPNWKLCGIEIFRVVDGKITEVWNSPYVDGRWGMARTLSAQSQSEAETGLPVITLDMTDSAAEAIVPLDARNIGRWIAQILGHAESRKAENGMWQHAYTGTVVQPLTLTMRDAHGPTRVLNAATVGCLHIGWHRSGMVNATISAAGVQGTAPDDISASAPIPAPAIVRLAEPVGAFSRDGQSIGRVVDAIIEIGTDAPKASGRISLRVAGEFSKAGDLGMGDLSFGWRDDGDFSLMFACVARLGAPENMFTDKGETEFSCAWTTDSISALVVNDIAS